MHVVSKKVYGGVEKELDKVYSEYGSVPKRTENDSQERIKTAIS
jgi:hypothetical protein